MSLIQRFVIQSKFSHIKQPIFWITYMTHSIDVLKATINSRRWNESQCYSSQQIQSQSQDFHIPTFYFPVSCLLYIVSCNTSSFSIFFLISFFFEDLFKSSKEQVTINDWYIKTDILVSRRYSAASGGKRQVEVRCNSIFPQTEPSQLY